MTDLDRVGIPNFMTVRPHDRGPGISYYNGKGTTRADAYAGAMMEAIERHAGERYDGPVIDASHYNLRRQHACVDPLEIHIPMGRNYSAGVNQATRLLDRAREAGNVIEATVFERLTRLQQPTNLRRFDVADDSDIADTALPLARAADTFVALRPNGQSNEPEGLIESLLYGTGHNLFLVPENWNP